MDQGEALKIANLYVDSINDRYNILQAFLFGSYAKGTNHDDSDIDVAVVVSNVSDIIDTQIEMMKLRRKIDLRIEPHPFITTDFNQNDPLVNEILTYGIRLKSRIA